MISVTIEYFIKPGQEAHYETLADRIHPEVYNVDGFISVEGYESRSEPGKRLSFSLWRDEDAVRAWRQHPEHARHGAAVLAVRGFADPEAVAEDWLATVQPMPAVTSTSSWTFCHGSQRRCSICRVCRKTASRPSSSSTICSAW